MAQAAVVTSTPSPGGWTFTQGLLLGQASFVVLCLLFVRYVVFQPAEDIDQDEWQRRRDERRKRVLLSTNVVPPPVPSQILGKTGYEMATHPAESTDWLNVLFAQILQGYRNDMLSNGGEEGARQRIERWLNPDNGGLSWIDPIQVTALSLGSAYPLLSNARIRPSDGQGHIRAEIDIDYLDSASLSLSTSLLINFPRPRFAVLPVSLGVQLASIGGTLSVQIHEPADERQQLHVCLLPDFHLNLKTTTLLGSRAKLQDIPKLEQLIMTRLRGIIQDRLVHPNHLTLTLPRLQSSPSQSTPIIADLGQRAVEAVREGLGKAASDFINLESPTPNPVAAMSPTTTTTDLDPVEASRPPSPPLGSVASRQTKRIPMPAGFPGYSSNAMNTPITPTPGRTATAFAQGPQSSSVSMNMGQSSSSAYGPPHPQTLQATGRTSSSLAPGGGGGGYQGNGSSNSQFRFRGQFASQPPTPGGYSDQAQGQGGRMGALNSRAS